MATRRGTLALAALLATAIAVRIFAPRASQPSSSSSESWGTKTSPSGDDDPLLSGEVVDDRGLYSRLKMCEDDGFCHENPAVPTPRTVYSSGQRRQHVRWWKYHASLISSAAEYASRRSSAAAAATGNNGRGRALILLGDSITESWLGTGLGEHRGRADGVPDVLRNLADTEGLDPLVLAASGDQTQHLLYHMDNGGILPPYADDPDAVFAVMIGTNNLGSGILPGPTAEGILAVAERVLSRCKGRLVLFSVLPRGDDKFKFLPSICPPRCDSRGDPFASFGPAVEQVNAALRKTAPELSRRHSGRLSLVDCSAPFVPEGGGGPGREVRKDLMPDQLHPNARGHRLLAKCLADCIEGKC